MLWECCTACAPCVRSSPHSNVSALPAPASSDLAPSVATRAPSAPTAPTVSMAAAAATAASSARGLKSRGLSSAGLEGGR